MLYKCSAIIFSFNSNFFVFIVSYWENWPWGIEGGMKSVVHLVFSLYRRIFGISIWVVLKWILMVKHWFPIFLCLFPAAGSHKDGLLFNQGDPHSRMLFCCDRRPDRWDPPHYWGKTGKTNKTPLTISTMYIWPICLLNWVKAYISAMRFPFC